MCSKAVTATQTLEADFHDNFMAFVDYVQEQETYLWPIAQARECFSLNLEMKAFRYH